MVLKGVFSSELAAQLASLFATKPFLQANGKLCALMTGRVIFVTDQKDVFSFFAKDKRYKKQDFTKEDSLRQLEQEAIPKPILEALKKHVQNSQSVVWSFIQLKTIAQTLKIQPTKNPLKAFSLFYSNPEDVNQLGEQLKQYRFFSYEGKWLDFMKSYFFHFEPPQEEEKRLEELTTQLDMSPYVFIMGPSGIGKSTLILEKLQPYYESQGGALQLSVGMEKLASWASNTAANMMHILFLDEANLNKEGSFDCFEGLFDDPPAIFIQGKQYFLTSQHKVIFCGNPAEFQGRQTHQFFQRHGYGLQFKNWSDQFLLTTFINPLLKQVCLAYSINLEKQDKIKIAQLFLNAYKDEAMQTQQSLTPRNLQMIVLRFARFCQSIEQAGMAPLQRAYLALYDELKPHLPKTERKSWKERFKQEKSYRELRQSHREDKLLSLNSNKYVVPPSRRRALQLIQNHLVIREQRINMPELQTQGLHGVLLEGASGIGKSALVIEQLRTLGYEENNADPTKRYHYLTLTDPGKIDEVLTKAFHEGAIVVIDELNTTPVEKILNALMSGVDLEGQLAQQPGFFVIATQNPIFFSNRQPLSPALANRFYKIDVKDYSLNELQRILVHKGVEAKVAEEYVRDYEAHNNKTFIDALKQTPRDLFRRS